MHKAFRAFVLLIVGLFLPTFLNAQYSAPIKTSQVNNTYYVGIVPGFYPSIQSAVTAACVIGNERVSIPVGVSPSDTIAGVLGGCSGVPIIDDRTFPSVCYSWSGSIYSNITCTAMASQLPNTFLAGPATGSSPSSPVFRTLGSTDIPSGSISTALSTGQGLQLYGDSICSGSYANPSDTNAFAFLIRPRIGGYFVQHCRAGDDSIDSIATYLDPDNNATNDGNYPITIFESVTNDISSANYGSTVNGQNTFQRLYQHAVYHSATATTLKSAPAVSLTGWTCTGTWTADKTTGSILPDYVSTTNANTCTYTLNASSGKAITYNYPIWNGNGGTFTITFNGALYTDPQGNQGTTFYNAGDNGSTITGGATGQTFGHAAIRLVTVQGSNTVKITVSSATATSNKVGIGWVALVPAFSPDNPVFVGLGPNHRNDSTANEALVPTYNTFIKNIIQQANTDGLNAYYVDIMDAFLNSNVPISLYVGNPGPGITYAASNWVSDQGVVYAATNIPFTKVTSSPSIGQYAVSTSGIYTFNAEDQSVPVFINKTINCGATVAAVFSNCSGDGLLHPNNDGMGIYTTQILGAIPSQYITGNNLPQSTKSLRSYSIQAVTPYQMMTPTGMGQGNTVSLPAGSLIPGISWMNNVNQSWWTAWNLSNGITNYAPIIGNQPLFSWMTYIGSTVPNSNTAFTTLMSISGNGIFNLNTTQNNVTGYWIQTNIGTGGSSFGVESIINTPYVGEAASFIAKSTYQYAGGSRASILYLGTGTGALNFDTGVGNPGETNCGVGSKWYVADVTAATGGQTGCIPLFTADSTHSLTLLYPIKNNSAQTTISCSTSGTAVFSEPEAGSSFKRVLVYLNACVGTVSYSYPIAFTITPQVLSQSIASSATTVTTTAVTLTGSTTTGFLELNGY